MIFVVSTMQVKPDRREAVLAAARVAITETRKEKGCIGYDLHVSITDPNKFVFVERWDDRDCLTAHMGTPHFKAWREVAGPSIDSRRVEIIAPEKVDVMT
jgi:quinol monooxygenase YgiN